MKIVDRHITVTVLSATLIVLLILVGLFAFFSFIDELDDIGKQRYGLQQVIQYVVLEIPQHIYDLFPSAVLLGSLLGLGILANHNELTVMRAAGLSILRIVSAVMRIGLLITLLVMLIGETLAPLSQQYAYQVRAIAQSEHEHQQIVFSNRYGFWARDGNDFINITTIFPDGGFGGITLYQFDEQQHLQTVTYARKAYYQNAQWLLEQVEKNYLQADQVTREYLENSTWNAVLKPELIKIVVIHPHQLSSLGLYKYIQYLKHNEQQTAQYEFAFWTRLTYPLTAITMVILAIPFIFGSLRSVSIGQRVLVGALIGVGFHMLNQAAGNIGLVYGINPILTALLPPLLFLVVALFLAQRVIF
jgi:lipopolysaccharide export system permease protein